MIARRVPAQADRERDGFIDARPFAPLRDRELIHRCLCLHLTRDYPEGQAAQAQPSIYVDRALPVHFKAARC